MQLYRNKYFLVFPDNCEFVIFESLCELDNFEWLFSFELFEEFFDPRAAFPSQLLFTLVLKELILIIFLSLLESKNKNNKDS